MPSAIKKLQDKQWMFGEYVEKLRTAEDIANEVGCDKSAVCRALKRLDIEVRKRTSKYALLSDEGWLRTKYIEEGHSLNEIAEMAGSTAGNVHAHLISKGIETRDYKEAFSVKYPDGRYGKQAARWQGGTRVGGPGYVYVYMPDHPNATKAGYVMQHHLVMEEEIGRYLESNEDVYHIDEDYANNRPDNLVVLSRSEHKIVHSLLKRLRKQQGENRYLKEKLERFLDECRNSGTTT